MSELKQYRPWKPNEIPLGAIIGIWYQNRFYGKSLLTDYRDGCDGHVYIQIGPQHFSVTCLLDPQAVYQYRLQNSVGEWSICGKPKRQHRS